MKQVPALLKAPVSIDWVDVGTFPFTGNVLQQSTIRKYYYRECLPDGAFQYFMMQAIENPFTEN